MTSILVAGVGVNDAEHDVKLCPFYKQWRAMIKDKGRSVCVEWLAFSNFKAWMEQQEWPRCTLDCELISPGNMLYSPETCVFLDRFTLRFIRNAQKDNPDASWHERAGKFQSRCRNPFDGSRQHIGYYDTMEDAVSAWRHRMREVSHQVANAQNDPRVADIVRSLFV